MNKPAILFLLAAVAASASFEGGAWASSRHSGSVHRFPVTKVANTKAKAAKTGKRKAPRGRRGSKKKPAPVVKG